MAIRHGKAWDLRRLAPVLALLRERVGAGHVRQVTSLDALVRQSDDAAPEPEVAALVHLGHAAAPDLRLDLIQPRDGLDAARE